MIRHFEGYHCNQHEINKKMCFLITGLSGFVGHHLANYLLENGHSVYGLLHNEQSKKICGVKYTIWNLRNNKPEEPEFLKLCQFDGIFHLASLTHPPTSFKFPQLYFETNALGAVNLCEFFGEYSIILQASTPEIYGICPNKEIYETQPINPISPYGVSKAVADLYIRERAINGNLKAFITRAGSHTGAGRPSCYSISSDAYQIAKIKKGLQEPIIKVGNIQSQRAVMDVRDVVEAYYKIMMKYIEGKLPYGEIYHISSYDLHTIEYYIDLMTDLAGIKAEKVVDESLVRKIDIPIQILNSDKIRSVIDWQPKIPIEQTLKDLLDYWKDYCNWKID